MRLYPPALHSVRSCATTSVVSTRPWNTAHWLGTAAHRPAPVEGIAPAAASPASDMIALNARRNIRAQPHTSPVPFTITFIGGPNGLPRLEGSAALGNDVRKYSVSKKPPTLAVRSRVGCSATAALNYVERAVNAAPGRPAAGAREILQRTGVRFAGAENSRRSRPTLPARRICARRPHASRLAPATCQPAAPLCRRAKDRV